MTGSVGRRIQDPDVSGSDGRRIQAPAVTGPTDAGSSASDSVRGSLHRRGHGQWAWVWEFVAIVSGVRALRMGFSRVHTTWLESFNVALFVADSLKTCVRPGL